MKRVSLFAVAALPIFFGCTGQTLDISFGTASQGGSTAQGSGGATVGTGGRGTATSGGAGGKDDTSAGGSAGNGTAGGDGGTPGCPVGTICCPSGAICDPPPSDDDPDRVIEMRFDDAAGATVSDTSGNQNHGTLRRGDADPSPVDLSPRWLAGRTGAAGDGSLELNGVDEWVRIPGTDAIDGIVRNNAFTVSIWVYVNALTFIKPFNVIVQRHALGVRGDHFMLGMLNGSPCAGQNHMGTNGPRDLPLAEWVHLALTFDQLTLTLYLNGEAVSHLDTGYQLVRDDTPVTLGAGLDKTDVQEFVNGRLDEFQLYARALSAIEVAHLAGR